LTSNVGRFNTVVLDVDSTLSGIEGIDWLAELRGPAVAEEVASLTERAMSAEIKLEDVYATRLALVCPSRDEVEALATQYIEHMAPGAREAIAAWRNEGVRTVLVSGGLREAILPLAAFAGVTAGDVFAVSIRFDDEGAYAGFDATSPLSVATGKRDIVASLELPRPVLAVGDGSTDVVIRDVADAFAAFTGFTARPAVLDRADFIASSFDELRKIVRP
jgi:phosphoserine phosphatase